MTDDSVHEYLLAKPAAWLDYPFGPDVRVYKVGKKMFATLGWESGVARTNLKCDPEHALALRDFFSSVVPGYHMNKTHWNTVILDDSVPDGDLRGMLDHSYALVARSLPKSERVALEVEHGKEVLYRGLVPSLGGGA